MLNSPFHSKRKQSTKRLPLQTFVTIYLIASVVLGMIAAPVAALAAAPQTRTAPQASADNKALESAVASAPQVPPASVQKAPAAAPQAQASGSGVLTITKSVVGNPGAVTSYNLTVTGPGGYTNSPTITPGTPVVLTGLASGIYTVSETSPGAGWTTLYTATTGYSTGSSGVVTLTAGAAGSTVTPVAAAAISGKVYHDFNSDGLLTTSGTVDTGMAGVTVTFYGVSGAACGSTTTANDGTYSFTPTCTGPWRVEFSKLPAGYEPTTHGTQNGTSVQFVTTSGASNINFGINQPCDYCQANPKLMMPAYLNGAAEGNSTLASDFAVIAYNYTSPAKTNVIDYASVGSLWGVAVRRSTSQVFMSAVLKRHSGLGPRDADGVYVFRAAQKCYTN